MSKQSEHIGDMLRKFQTLTESVDKETRLQHDTMPRHDEHGVGKYIARFNDFGVSNVDPDELVNYAKNGGIDAVLDYVIDNTVQDLNSSDMDQLWDIADALVTDIDSRVSESEDDNGPVTVMLLVGAGNKKVKKTFKSQAAWEKWYDNNEGNFEVLSFLDESNAESVNESQKPYVSMYGSEAEVLDSNGKTVKTFTRKEHGVDYKKKASAYLQKNFNKLKIEEGYYTVPSIDRVRYGDRSSEGLEGPFQAKNGKVYYYDPREGKAYDPDTDMFISHDEYSAMNEDGDSLSPDHVDAEGRFVVVFDPEKRQYHALAMNQHYANILPMSKGFASVQDAIDDAEEAIDNQLVGQQMESFSSVFVSKALVESGVHHTRAMRVMAAMPHKKAYSINDVTKALDILGESCECQDRVRNALGEASMDIKVGDKIRTKKWGQSLGVVTGFTQKHGETRVLFKNEDGKTWSTPPENIEKVTEEVTEVRGTDYYYLEVTPGTARKALEILDDQFRGEYDTNGSNFYTFDNDQIAYNAALALENGGVEFLDASPEIFDDDAPTWDRSSGEDEYDLDEANQRSVRSLYTEYRDAEGRFEVVYNQEKGLYLVKPSPEFEDDIEPAAFHTLNDAIEHAEIELEQWDDEGFDAGGAYDMQRDKRRFNEADDDRYNDNALPDQGPIEPSQLPKSIQEFVAKLFGVYWDREGQANVIPYSAGYGYTYKNSAGPGNTGRGLLRLGVVGSEEELYANGRPKDNFKFKLGDYSVSLAFRGNAAMLRFSGPMEESVDEVSSEVSRLRELSGLREQGPTPVERGSKEHNDWVEKKRDLERQMKIIITGEDRDYYHNEKVEAMKDPQKKAAYDKVKAEFDKHVNSIVVKNAPRPQSARSQETDGRYVGGRNRYTGD